MNYKLIYENLTDLAKNRTIDIYTESHHIVPRCMNGDNSKENLVDLTPEEHYLAHQLLVKIYPTEYGLVKAAAMMCMNVKNQRPTNKLYGWLRKRLSRVISKSQTGNGNSQFGRIWICCQETGTIKRIENLDTIPSGWHRGKSQYSCCEICQVSTNTRYNKFCKDHRQTNCSFINPEIRKIALTNAQTSEARENRKVNQKKNNHQSGQNNSQYNTCWITNGNDVKKISKSQIKDLEPGWVLGRNISLSYNE